MTDDVLDDPILDDRIRRALTALADAHTPIAAAPPIGARRGRSLLGVAATFLVLVGVGALVVAGQRDGASSPMSTQSPDPVDFEIPEPTAPDPTTPPTSTASEVSAFRFDGPLPAGTIAVLDPAPFPFVEAFRAEQPDVEFLTGRGPSVQILVLDADSAPEAMVTITDLDVPLDRIESRETLPVSDATTLHYAGVGVETFFVVAGSSIREVSVPNLRLTDNEFSQFDERLSLAAEVAAEVEGQQLEDLILTGRFAPLPTQASGPTVSSYSETGVQGEGELVDVAVVTTERPIDRNEFPLVASALGEILDRPAPNAVIAEMFESPQLLYFEQISATQFVLISTDLDMDRTTLDTIISSLAFVDAEAVGIDVGTLGGDIGQVLARGDDNWGRWELYESVDGDECYGFGAGVWSAGSMDTQQSSSAGCGPDEGTPTTLACVTMSTGDIAGVYLGDGSIGVGHPSIDVAVVAEHDGSVDGVGTPTSFLIEPAGAVGPVAILIDGEPVSLPCR